VGGDGTNNEVVNGFFDEESQPISPDAAFGFLPRGTGCDFARYLGIPRGDVVNAARIVAESPTWPIDLAELTVTTADGGTRKRIYLNISDFGIGGEICARVNRGSKMLGGFLSFLWHSIVALAVYTDKIMELDVEGGESLRGPFRSVVVANGRFFGGGMNINPAGSPDDGLLDLITLPDEGFFHYMKWFPSLYSEKGVLHHPRIPHHKITALQARCADPDEDVWVEMDGENPGKLPLAIRVLPGAMRMRAPYPGDLSKGPGA
jgi:YegS/Rv2252/BmrU family lipid kinase